MGCKRQASVSGGHWVAQCRAEGRGNVRRARRRERDVRCRREPTGVGTPDRPPHGSRRPRYHEGDRCAHMPDMAPAREDARCCCTPTRSQPSPYREPEPSGSRPPDTWARLTPAPPDAAPQRRPPAAGATVLRTTDPQPPLRPLEFPRRAPPGAEAGKAAIRGDRCHERDREKSKEDRLGHGLSDLRWRERPLCRSAGRVHGT